MTLLEFLLLSRLNVTSPSFSSFLSHTCNIACHRTFYLQPDVITGPLAMLNSFTMKCCHIRRHCHFYHSLKSVTSPTSKWISVLCSVFFKKQDRNSSLSSKDNCVLKDVIHAPQWWHTPLVTAHGGQCRISVISKPAWSLN